MWNKKLLEPLKIAVSGKSGCGNSSLVAKIATMLSIKEINYTFRNLAADQFLSFNQLRQEAECDDRFDRMLDAKQLLLASQGDCVLGSRLAIWMLKDADLKVYLDISIDERIRRIHQRESGLYEDKKVETILRDKQDHDRYQRIYGIDNDDFSFVDLIISDGSLSVDQIAMNIIKMIPSHYFKD